MSKTTKQLDVLVRKIINGKDNKQSKSSVEPLQKDKSINYKRKLKIPSKIVDNDSIEVVASFWGPIQTIPITDIVKDIIFDRFSIEIIDKYKFSFTNRKSNKSRTNVTNNEPRRKKKRSTPERPDDSQPKEDSAITQELLVSQSIIRQRIIIGTNQVTRLLETYARVKSPKPLLVFLTNDMRPPTMVMHIPCICRQLGIPILVIPGSQSSLELGKIVGVKNASIIAFTSRLCIEEDPPMEADETLSNMESVFLSAESCQSDIDSFVNFVKTKVPK